MLPHNNSNYKSKKNQSLNTNTISTIGIRKFSTKKNDNTEEDLDFIDIPIY